MSLFDIFKLNEELNSLEEQTMNENFWNDSKNSKKVLSRIKQLKYKAFAFHFRASEEAMIKHVN